MPFLFKHKDCDVYAPTYIHGFKRQKLELVRNFLDLANSKFSDIDIKNMDYGMITADNFGQTIILTPYYQPASHYRIKSFVIKVLFWRLLNYMCLSGNLWSDMFV